MMVYYEKLVEEMQNDIKLNMEFNWKILHGIDQVFAERELFYKVLFEIEVFFQFGS